MRPLAQIGYAQVESCLSKVELEKQVEKVDLEKKLLDYNIIQQRENLVKMETLYLIMCQLTDAIMVVEIVVSFIMADVSGLSMFNDMRIQADDERYRAINDPESCLAKPCITVQNMACSYWRDCGAVLDIDTGEAYPNCGAYCRIAPEVRSWRLRDPNSRVLAPLKCACSVPGSKITRRRQLRIP